MEQGDQATARTPSAGARDAPVRGRTRQVPALERDLLATAQAGRTHNLKAATQAGQHIARDFTALAAAVKVLKKKLGLLA